MGDSGLVLTIVGGLLVAFFFTVGVISSMRWLSRRGDRKRTAVLYPPRFDQMKAPVVQEKKRERPAAPDPYPLRHADGPRDWKQRIPGQ